MDKTLIDNSIPEAIQKKDTLLKGLFTGEISMAEFDKECAYWLINSKDLSPLPLPTRPRELQEYDTWTSTEKKNTSDKFWRQDAVYKYVNQKQFVIDRNKSMLSTLKEFKEYIPKEDTITRNKYDLYINMYGAPEELKSAIDTFGGEIVERGCKEEPF